VLSRPACAHPASPQPSALAVAYAIAAKASQPVGAMDHGYRNPSRGTDRSRCVHRSRHGRGDRRNGCCGRSVPAVSGRYPGRHGQSPWTASPHAAIKCGGWSWRQGAWGDRGGSQHQDWGWVGAAKGCGAEQHGSGHPRPSDPPKRCANRPSGSLSAARCGSPGDSLVDGATGSSGRRIGSNPIVPAIIGGGTTHGGSLPRRGPEPQRP